MQQDDSEKAIKDCTDSIELHPHYVKPLLRRAQLYEKTDKLDEALEDYKKVVELDRGCSEAFLACQVLAVTCICTSQEKYGLEFSCVCLFYRGYLT